MNNRKRRPEPRSAEVLTTVAEGLETLCLSEIKRRFADAAVNARISDTGEIRFRFSGDLSALGSLNISDASYIALSFDIPRPRGLLGDQNLREIVSAMHQVLDRRSGFETLELSAAGSDTSVMERIRSALCQDTTLKPAAEKGDLLVRIRPLRTSGGWEVLIRTAPRPTSARSWRVCNLEGALNGPVAYAMHELVQCSAQDVVVNLGSGSGSLMIERMRHTPAATIIGVERSWEALLCSRRNLEAAGMPTVPVICGDMTHLPFPDGFADVICADLPFGQLVGSHEENVRLYPAMLAEAGRIARLNGRMVLLTHEVRLVDAAFARSPWRITGTHRISLRGLHPRVYVAIRK